MFRLPTWEEELDAELDGFGIENFSAREVTKAGGAQARFGEIKDPMRPRWKNIIPTLFVLEELREATGGPIIVLSGYRDGLYNARVGGASNSLHVRFNAVDFRIPNVPPAEIREWLEAHRHSDGFGIGRYSSFVHLDTRGVLSMNRARW